MTMAYTVDPGEMTERVTLRQPVLAKDAVGQTITTYTDTPVWAKHVPISLRDREAMAAGQKQATQHARFIIRHRADITGTWRLIWGGVEHNIISATQPDRSWTDVLCERGLP